MGEMKEPKVDSNEVIHRLIQEQKEYKKRIGELEEENAKLVIDNRVMAGMIMRLARLEGEKDIRH